MIDSGTLLQGRFLIEDQVGRGGMGAVYRAIDQKFGSRVAIKETFYGDTELAPAFEREARLLNALHHPILPHVSDSFTENGGNFLVMEYIDGDDLSQLLKRGQTFSVETVVRWALELLDGLDYLHSQDPPVIHRDIKPNNLKLTSRGKIVLLDFGMAKETSTSTLEARSVFGYSRRYSPLEQIEGNGTDARSDIFSLGASLYHLLTGIPATDVLARASAIVAGRPDPLIPANEINPEIPKSIALALNSALALSLENRFESARAMSDALEQALETQAPDRENANVTSGAVAVVEDSSELPAADPVAVLPASNISGDMSTGDSDKGFTARSAVENFRNRMRPPQPTAAVGSSGRTPVSLRNAAWLSILLLCVGLAAFAAYRLAPTTDEVADRVTTPTATENSDDGTEAITQSVNSSESNLPLEDVSSSEPKKSTPDTIVSNKGPIPVAENQRRVGETVNASKEASQTQRLADQADQKATSSRTTTRNSRKSTKPAFEQPAVSSIEAIMSGVPYEGRPRWVYERDRIEEERRRRRMRRMRRYQEPF